MTIRKKEKLVIQGQEIEYVNAYKYVGVVMLNANTSNSKEIASLGQKCNSRIGTLKTIASTDFGGTVNALKTLYRSTIGGIVNKSASTFLPLSK